jgi:hypothetical protein
MSVTVIGEAKLVAFRFRTCRMPDASVRLLLYETCSYAGGRRGSAGCFETRPAAAWPDKTDNLREGRGKWKSGVEGKRIRLTPLEMSWALWPTYHKGVC